MTKVVGTPRWNAPELLEGDSYTEKVDVYSFGIVMWELIARKLPFENINKQSELEDFIIDGNRPPIPDYCPPIFKEVMEGCWKQIPSERLSFDVVVKKLQESRKLEKVDDSLFPQSFEEKKPESLKNTSSKVLDVNSLDTEEYSSSATANITNSTTN